MKKPKMFTKKELDKTQTGVVKPKSKSMLFFKIAVIFFILSWTVYGMYTFFSTYKLRTPIIIQLPYELKELDILSPVATQSAQPTLEPQTLEIEGIMNRIYTLESSNGKNDSCKDRGLFNGYGYGQSLHAWNCFTDLETVQAVVHEWIQDKIDRGYTESELVCYYNTGYRTIDCPYYQNYLALK